VWAIRDENAHVIAEVGYTGFKVEESHDYEDHLREGGLLNANIAERYNSELF
jgi:hypothetical protein